MNGLAHHQTHLLTLSLLLLANLFLHPISMTQALAAGAVSRKREDYLPDQAVEYRQMDIGALAGDGSRRVLEPFQLCFQCRCCAGGDPSNCSMMPCCFGISCDIPDKPYGVCAFVPKNCSCASCA